MNANQRPSSPCACGHVAQHHTRRDSVYAGLMADYRVVWRCAWNGCGCPEYVPALTAEKGSEVRDGR